MQNEFISIQAAADEYGISTRWIWKSTRVDRTLGAVVRNERIYLRRIEWEAFVEQHFVSDVSAVFGNGRCPFETGIQSLIQIDRCIVRGCVELVAGLNLEIQILTILLTGGKPEGEGSCGEQHDIFQYGFHVFFLIG